MGKLEIKIVNKEAQKMAQSIGQGEVQLFYEKEYKQGDQIVIRAEGDNKHLVIQIDDALGATQVYLKGEVITYTIPFGEQRDSMSPKVFMGDKHYLYVREAREEEIHNYRNLAVNVMDQHGEVNAYPHAAANVETRGESVFAAKNAIDGVTLNDSHGNWPYASWGINRQDNAEFSLKFGRVVEIDQVILYTRADFPHDNWWRQVKLSFSDGSEIIWNMEKSNLPHKMKFEPKKVEWIKLSHLIKADDPSPFPALTQIQVYGKDI